jgi:predicted component of type VI protein secretion system
MPVMGGSHTNFDSGAFTAGALTGSGAIAGALVAGVANHLARARAQRGRAWQEADWQRALALSELLRRRDQQRARDAEVEVAKLRARVAWALSAPRVATARALIRR